MTYRKAVVYIGVGINLLMVILGAALIALGAGELPFLLLMPVVLCLGGLLNYFAIVRYDSAGPPPHR